ncbi:FxsA protein [Candidatus Terasakiella magnetica]|uniref:FxsA protein n=1 Tax=Candidatus Terasakiella magnetica TaxID=1867952 RepID=A0A1C3RGE7_9PROT|nr:FxsA family protein [Candidatus Terasakiella magnetica]SCA56335.1 FxsA protein [Candidatus Terasakiella magnetica]
MGFIILLLFIAVPVTEIAVFIQVGDIIGLWSTIAIVILTAIIGTALLRQQGISTLMRAQATLNEGKMPTTELFDGACLLVAGALLLTPGFVTDTVGFLLFTPPFRAILRHKAKDIVKNSAHVHMMGPDGQPFRPHPPHSSSPHEQSHDSTVIDGDFEEIQPNPDSPWSEKKD